MKQSLKTAYGYINRLGLDPLRGASNLKETPRFLANLRAFKSIHHQPDLWPLGDLFPCLGEASEQSGTATGHYFHQDLLVARRVHQRAPRNHADVGSRLDGFVAHVASFREIEVFDIRQMTSRIPNVTFRQCDLTGVLPSHLARSTDSLSCLHALEHFGLGRYGDPIDPSGHVVALENLARIVEPGGWFYLSVPIGPQRIEFNAHRVFSLGHLLDLVAPWFDVRTFSYVDDRGDLHEDAGLVPEGVASSFGCHYGCGIVEMQRRP